MILSSQSSYSTVNPLMIAVGIATEGAPVLENEGENTRLLNQRIGLGFHWEKTVESVIPGEVVLSDDLVYRVINRLPLERYLECVVGSEMNPDAPIEFLKAHVVISRSWAMGKISGCHDCDSSGKVDSESTIINWEDTGDHSGFDVCADDHCQRYQGIQQIAPRVLEAIRSTAGLALYSPSGQLIDARFSKCCGGRTEVFSSCWQDRTEPSLESFDDPWCNLSGLSPEKRKKVLKSILKDYDLENEGGYRWSTEINAEEIKRNLRRKFERDIGEVKDLQIIERGKSGRAIRLKATGSRGKIELGKELMIRRLLAPTHLYSSWIEIAKDSGKPGKFLIDGRGWGHGVGLCQIGAARMAIEGYNFKEILSFYYPGSILR